MPVSNGNYQLDKQRSNFAGRFGQLPSGSQRAQRGFGGMVTGEVISQDEKSRTVKIADGSSKIIILGDLTTYSQSQSALKSDLKVGDKVGVWGTANSDGSITATSVQLNPEFFNGTRYFCFCDVCHDLLANLV